VIVVSNTSPLTNLAAIGQLDMIRQLYGQLHIPIGVWNELNANGVAWPGRDEVMESSWISRERVKDIHLVNVLRNDLDRGEAETIALAVEIHADLVLLDEKEGRRIAQRLGLRVSGVVGLLVLAKSQGKLKEVRPYLDALREVAGFYLSDSVYTNALRMAGE